MKVWRRATRGSSKAFDDLGQTTNVRMCEGFQTPAVTNIPPPTRPASGNLQGTKARGGARIRPCHALSYGDLTADGPQLRSAVRVSTAVRMTMQVGGDAFM